MTEFQTGDKIVSNRFGSGKVTGPSKAVKDGVLVDFGGSHYDCIYHRITGKRIPACGNDTITK